MQSTIIRTKEQINKKRQEIARLEAEVSLLESKLEQQQQLLDNYNKAKEAMEKAAQDLIDSQYFDYEDVLEDCKTVTINEGRSTRPVKLETINKTKANKEQVSKFAKQMNQTTHNINKLSEDIDNGIVTKEEATRLLIHEIDTMINNVDPKSLNLNEVVKAT